MKQCKRDGESMRNQDVVNADRISQLPEALILLILSLLPTKVAVATSVLSKQWKSLWKMLPKLKFTSYVSYNHSRELGTFSKNVRKALLSHRAPVLESLHLKIHLDRCNAFDTGILIGIAFALNVRKLVLEVEPRTRFIFPKSLYNCETLESLEVKISVLMDVPSSVCFKSLRTLHLHYVDFKDDESVLNLLSGCPNLENLDVHGTLYCNVKPFTIAIPSLQRLSICNRNDVQHVGYVINAPSLKYLKIVWIGGLGSCLIENAPMLLEANIINNDSSFILGSLTSVKHLSLEISALEIPFPTGSIFYQLVYLELCIYRASDWWNLLTLMLNTSPNLQVLKLIGPQPWHKWLYGVPLGKWNQPNNVPQCLLFHLETFVWKDYEWRENEKEVTKYILSNASRLEKATFFRKRLTSKERVAMVEELETVIKASSSCQLVFK